MQLPSERLLKGLHVERTGPKRRHLIPAIGVSPHIRSGWPQLTTAPAKSLLHGVHPLHSAKGQSEMGQGWGGAEKVAHHLLCRHQDQSADAQNSHQSQVGMAAS